MEKWNKDSLEAAFANKEWLVGSREIEHATQFNLRESVKVNLYQTGTLTFGGPNSAFKSEVEAYVRAGPDKTNSTGDTPGASVGKAQPTAVADRRVFVVYGHDITARNELELLLRRIQVRPIILENIPGVGDTLIEKLESLTDADFACVLLTPDDIGAAKNTPCDLRSRARQNVVLELGMVLSRLGRRKVAILVKGDEIEKPSDIDGLIYIAFKENVSESANSLGAALASAGFPIDILDLHGS